MLTFVIPVYAPNLTLFKKCLMSLVNQSLKDWEAIVVFDGENAGASATVGAINDKRFKQVLIPHGGAQKARNAGAKEAKGDILCFWDCDCIIEPGAAKMWVDEFAKNPGISFIYSGYKFLDEKGGIPSEPFDPWTLKCGNYISTCFPMRKSVFPGFDETLHSLQDWDIWLTIVENGGKGKFVPGYAFSTAYPTEDSISGKNCREEVWLDRVRAIKVKHNLPNRKVCVSSIGYREEGIRLAKLIDADYKDVPNHKPNLYETVIQVGFSLHPKHVQLHSSIFNQKLKKKIIFWTMADVLEINNFLSLKAIRLYAERLNAQCLQFVEDMAAKKIMEGAGFNVKVMPLPMVNTAKIDPLPETPKVLVDITDEYRPIMACLEHSLPDIEFGFITSDKPIKDYSAILALNPERTTTFNIKRMLVAGRNVISNVQAPFCGYVSDEQPAGKYIPELVDTIRKRVSRPTGCAVDYYKKALSVDGLMEVLK